MLRLIKRQIIAVALAGLLAACGGGGGGGGDGGGSGGVIGGGSSGGGTGGGGGAGGTPTGTPPTAEEASRLLTQATFGPTDAAIQEVISAGSINSWITAQIAKPQASVSHLAFINNLWQNGAGTFPDNNQVFQTWWRQAISEQAQLRQRVAFALSQIFVISLNDENIDSWGAASYYDMLLRDAFVNFRTLLEDVTMHPMMGRYLTYLANQKEDNTRQPDENYAREVMQLMTIGLHELNADGTPRLNNGQRIPTYTSADVSGLAKVFTGLSWYNSNPSSGTFYAGVPQDNSATTRSMIFYPAFHSTSAKSFLGTTIPASSTVDGPGELKIALDKLFNHANTGPFISHRLIQQLVTSNPSPEYVGRVAAVFANNGSGVRGDLAAVIRAILNDTEARNMSAVSSPTFGKIREPVIRVTNWARAFNATSQSGLYMFVSTSGSIELSQTPLASPSVFNFWRPGYTPPATTQLGQRNLVSPEFQIVDEVTAPAYVNLIQSTIQNGIGWTAPGCTTCSGPDVKPNYAAELAIADNASTLVDRMNKLLFYGQMSSTLRDRIIAGVNAIAMPAAGASQASIDAAKLTRVRTAIFFSMVSPEYLIQR